MILSSFCIPESLKSATKNLRPKIILTMYFACTREVILNSSKLRDFIQAFGPQLSIFDYLAGVGSLPLLIFSQWKKPYGVEGGK